MIAMARLTDLPAPPAISCRHWNQHAGFRQFAWWSCHICLHPATAASLAPTSLSGIPGGTPAAQQVGQDQSNDELDPHQPVSDGPCGQPTERSHLRPRAVSAVPAELLAIEFFVTASVADQGVR